MLYFPNVKINLGLNVVERRPDGYHNLETVFYPLPLADMLEVVFPDDCHSDYVWQSSGIDVGTDAEHNLCIKALRLLKEVRELPCVGLHLHKVVPTGAGLGGGSSDGAFVLAALNDLLSLGLSANELRAIAARLGADCPFFIDNKPAYATGIGDVLSPISIPQLRGLKVVLVKPQESVSTAEAYAGIVPHLPNYDIRKVLAQNVESWKDSLSNDFEVNVFRSHPVIAEVKNALYEHGALYAQMSGSGSAVFGIFAHDAALPSADNFGGMFFWCGELLG